MTKKLSKLVATMESDTALTNVVRNPNAPTVLPATPASTGQFAQPQLHEELEALMIMEGLTGRWCVNYWRLENKYGAIAHVSGKNDWDEWQNAIEHLKTVSARHARV